MSNVVVVLKEENPVSPADSKSWRVSLPADAPVKHVLNALIPKLGLPTQVDGRNVMYRLYHLNGNRTLKDMETLTNAGVLDNDICLLQKKTGNYTNVPKSISVTEKGKPQPPKPHPSQQPGSALVTAANDIITKSYALLSQTCAHDNRQLVFDDKIVCCPVCGTLYHHHCWHKNGNQCSQPGCKGQGTIQPQEFIHHVSYMSEVIGDLMEELLLDASDETEEVFEALKEVDFQLLDLWDELDEKEVEEIFRDIEEVESFRDAPERDHILPISIPSTLKYTAQHVWIDTTRHVGRCGITDFLVQQIFLTLDVELPEKGQTITAGEVVSSLWVLSDSLDEIDIPVLSPVSGVITAVNENLKEKFPQPADPELICEDPYGEGWLFTIQPVTNTEGETLMDAETYHHFISTL